MRAVRREESGEAENPAQRLEALADKLVEKGLYGDIPALKEIGDRLDGKAVQPISGDDEKPPIQFENVGLIPVIAVHDESAG